jgi:hypothetical protein
MEFELVERRGPGDLRNHSLNELLLILDQLDGLIDKA